MSQTFLTSVQVDTRALQHNLKEFRRHLSPNVRLMPVVKSNAYGHGMVPVASFLAQSGLCHKLGVVSLQEALILRRHSVTFPVCILSYGDWFHSKCREDIIEGIRLGVEFPLYERYLASLLQEAGESIGRSVLVHIKMDSGTSRVGILSKDILSFVSFLRNQCPRLQLVGFWTHLARAEDPEHDFNRVQLRAFHDAVALLQEKGFRFAEYHSSASAALMAKLDTFSNLGRPGIAIYGLWPSADVQHWMSSYFPGFQLQPVLQWKTRLIQVKDIPKGSFIGYDCTYQAQRKTRLGVIPVGYFDGYDRLLSNTGYVLIRGRRAKILGRICMNLSMIDVTDVPGVTHGDEVVLIGTSGDAFLSCDQLASWARTIHYEFVSRIHPDIPRIYI